MLTLSLVAYTLLITSFPHAFRQVADGYQDESGFHYVTQSQADV
jgi:hypothetical protein